MIEKHFSNAAETRKTEQHLSSLVVGTLPNMTLRNKPLFVERCSSSLSDATVTDCDGVASSTCSSISGRDDTKTAASTTTTTTTFAHQYSSWLSSSSSNSLSSVPQPVSSSCSSSCLLEDESQPETLETVSSSEDVEDVRGASYYNYSNDNNSSSTAYYYQRLLRHRRSSGKISEPNQHHHHYYNTDDLPQDHDYDEPPKEVVPDNDQWHNIQTDVDVETYMAKRSMTALQERWNAITILPNPLFCLYYLWSAAWVVLQQPQPQQPESEHWSSVESLDKFGTDTPNLNWWNRLFVTDEHGCLPGYPDYHSMPALPPLPLVAVFVGIALHAPFSFLYHWQYAFEHGAKHWSRRMDQAMIHVCSACFSYAATGNIPFFTANVVYNLICCHRLFSPHERPLRNQARIIVSVLLYTLPILYRGDVTLFGQLWIVFLVSGWCFATYPLGGWSHTVFHLIIALKPQLMLRVAATLPAAAAQLELAAYCATAATTRLPPPLA